MQKTKSSLAFLLSGLLVTVSLLVAGCSSGIDEKQMQALNDLKAEIETLKRDVDGLETEKAMLEKQLAEKNAMLKKCNDDQAVVRQRLGQ